MSLIVRILAAPSLRGRLLSALFLLIGIAPLSAQITEYPVSVYALSGIAAGPDGAMWFSGNGHIGRITTGGVVTSYQLPTSNAGSAGITAGPDGAMWFTEYSNGSLAKIGRITTSGVFTEYALPNPASAPTAIAAGPDGALWFIESGTTNIGRITTSGTITEFPLPTSDVNNGVFGITAGPDGNLWFTSFYDTDKILRMTTSGVFTTYTVSTAVSYGSYGITAGPDGAMWFADSAGNLGFSPGSIAAGKIGRITTSGTITEYPLPQASDYPLAIAAGPDGALWFTDYLGQIGRVTTSGTVTSEVATPTNTANGDLGYGPGSIAAGPDGAMWFIEPAGTIGRIPTGVTPTPPTILSGSVANGATYVAGGLVPGSWAQAKGSNLATVTNYIWQSSDFAGLGNNLPTKLQGTSVTVNGLPAAVYYVDPAQVNFQVPTGISGTASVQVTVNSVTSNVVTGASSSTSPGIFPVIVNGINYAGGVFTDGKYIGDPSVSSAFRNATPGDAVQLFTTGLTTTPAGVLITSQGVSGVTVTIGTITFPADFAGLVTVGEFQVNFTVPQQFASMPAASYPITISVNGVSSPATINSAPPGQVVIPIQP